MFFEGAEPLKVPLDKYPTARACRCGKIIERGNNGCELVCSSRPIKEKNYTDEDHPHIQAVKHYRETAENKNGEFVCLMEYQDKDKPKPLVFRFTDGGPQKKSIGTAAAVAITNKVSASTPRYGLLIQ